MDLFEYQGKQFFASFDIPVSKGEAVTTVEDAVAAAERIGDSPSWSRRRCTSVAAARPAA